MNNPFSTSFGIEPTNYILRKDETKLIIDEFTSLNPSNFVYLITGVRGSGKTVLLSSISSLFKKENDWIVVNPMTKTNILENIAGEIYENSNAKKLFIKKSISFSFHGFSLSIHGETPVSSVTTLIKMMLEVIKKDNKRVLITIDEVDNSPEMKTFVEVYQNLLREQYPVFLLMTGLYENIYQLQDNKSLTFLYRAPKIFLNGIDIRSITYSYASILNIDINEALELANLTKGYAYAYQLLGYLLVKNNKTKADKEILLEFDKCLAEYSYDKIYEDLSSFEIQIISNVNTNQEVKVEDLYKKLKVDQKYFSVYRDRLIKKGLFVAKHYGLIEFALPRFVEFLLFN